MKKIHFLHCHLAGFSFYDGVLAFENLKIGTELQLKHDPTNHYDKYAVEIYYNEHKLGFIPRGINPLQNSFSSVSIALKQECNG